MAFLHDQHDKFQNLIEIASRDRGVPLPMVEKDYWIMHCLWGLQQQGFDFFLKGGTSLSKGFGIIDRFSEDIDIVVIPPKDKKVRIGKNDDKTSHIKSRRDFFNWFVGQIKIAGIVDVKYDPNASDKKARNAEIVLQYGKDTHDNTLKEGILLEVRFYNAKPFVEKNISSWIYDLASNMGLKFRDNRASAIKCYKPEYTFVEKLQAISKKFRQQQESGEMSRNFLRHYYDIYKLLELEEVRAFIGSKDYFEYKDSVFQNADEKNLANNQAFVMTDKEIRGYYTKRYEESSILYYKGKPSFSEILARISQIIPIG